MGVRVEAGVARGRMARACGGAAPVSRRGERAASQSCRAAPRSLAAERRERLITRPVLLCDSRAALSRVVVLYDGTA